MFSQFSAVIVQTQDLLVLKYRYH